MSSYLPSLKQLQYLVALKDHGHFGRAAQACFVTQSTLSGGLKELETLLGASLVERSRRALRFTPTGNAIADKARRVLREAEELADLARAAGKPLSGELRMGVIPTIAPFLLPRLLPGLRTDWPELKLYLREETSQAACDALHRGQLDCVLLALPFGCGEVEAAELFSDRLMVAFPPGQGQGHARTATGGARGRKKDAAQIDAAEIDPKEIDGQSLLLLEDGHCLKDHALAACNRPELRAGAAMLGTSLHTLVQMVAGGVGTTLIPKMAVEAGLLDGTGVTARPLKGAQAVRRIALVWRKGSPREKEFRILAEALSPAD